MPAGIRSAPSSTSSLFAAGQLGHVPRGRVANARTKSALVAEECSQRRFVFPGNRVEPGLQSSGRVSNLGLHWSNRSQRFISPQRNSYA